MHSVACEADIDLGRIATLDSIEKIPEVALSNSWEAVAFQLGPRFSHQNRTSGKTYAK